MNGDDTNVCNRTRRTCERVIHVRMSGVVVSCSDEKGDVSDDEEDCVMLGVAKPEKSPIACAAGQTIVVDYE